MSRTGTGDGRTKVVLLIDWILPGAAGAERFAVALARALPQDRYHVTMCTTRAGSHGHLLEALKADGVEHLDVARRGRWDVGRWVRLVRHLRRERVDIVHGHKFGSNAYGALAGQLAAVPAIVAHEHSWSYEGQPWRRIIDGRWIAPLSDAFVAVSHRDRDRMISVEHVRPEKTRVILTAYLPREQPSDTDIRGELGIGPDVPLLGTLCVLRRQKRLDVLLDAMAIVHEKMPRARLVIGGGGECEADLVAQIARLGLGDVVTMLGMRQDADAIWRSLDLAVMSSDFEGMPLAGIEAMLNGAPLVATSVGGLPELLEDGRSGVLVPRRDPQALADGILRVLEDPALREELAQAARRRGSQFTLENVVTETTALYDELLGRAAERSRRRPRQAGAPRPLTSMA